MKAVYIGVASHSDYLIANALAQAFPGAPLVYFLADALVGDLGEDRLLDVQNHCIASSSPLLELFLLREVTPNLLDGFTHVVLNFHELFAHYLTDYKELQRFLSLLATLFDRPGTPLPTLVFLDVSYDNYIFSKMSAHQPPRRRRQRFRTGRPIVAHQPQKPRQLLP